jgi:hypothetical protein
VCIPTPIDPARPCIPPGTHMLKPLLDRCRFVLEQINVIFLTLAGAPGWRIVDETRRCTHDPVLGRSWCNGSFHQLLRFGSNFTVISVPKDVARQYSFSCKRVFGRIFGKLENE